MSADDLLGTLLRSLQQSPHGPHDARQYLGAALSCLTTLTNPLNVTLLTSHLLTAPVLWLPADQLDLHLSFLSLFHTAVISIGDRHSAAQSRPLLNQKLTLSSHPLDAQTWVQAVIDGVDTRSPPVRHVLVLGGLLAALAGRTEHLIPSRQYQSLQSRFVDAANATLLHDVGFDSPSSQMGLVLALNHTFAHLSVTQLSRLDCDTLLSLLMTSLLHAQQGLDSLDVIGTLDRDVVQASPTQFDWPSASPSFLQVQSISTRPLVQSLGPLARLIAHSLENVRDSSLVPAAVQDLCEFCTRVNSRWHANKLAKVDFSEEFVFLTRQTTQHTLPVLWQLLKSTLFAVVIVLKGAIARLLDDGALANSHVAPRIAQNILTALARLNFVLSKLESATFSQFEFTRLAAIDILTAYPTHANDFVQVICPRQLGSIPQHPLDRQSDLFFFNTVEHMTLSITQSTNETVLEAARPYLVTDGNPGLLSLFEAAHSATLAVFSAPRNIDATVSRLPSYIATLCASFPRTISARQFRLAFRHLVRISSPPSPICFREPLLAATLLEILHDRSQHASNSVLPVSAGTTTPQPTTEQAAIVFALIDCLPVMSIDLLDDWLPLTAQAIPTKTEPVRSACAHHFWNTIFGAGMDPAKAHVCVVWWTTLGGRDLVAGPVGHGDDDLLLVRESARL